MNYEYQETFEVQPEYEYEGEFGHEMHENELAHELINLENEYELEQFLGNLVKRAWGGAKALYNSPIGQQLKSQAVSGLKSFGKRALPGLASSLGGRFLGPAGAQLGGQLGNLAVRGLGLEFEGGTPLDRRYEGSRRFVRIAKAAARRIAAYARSGRPLTNRVIHSIILREGRRGFPNLPIPTNSGSGYQNNGNTSFQSDNAYTSTAQNRGTWFRQGNRIVIQGL